MGEGPTRVHNQRTPVTMIHAAEPPTLFVPPCSVAWPAPGWLAGLPP